MDRGKKSSFYLLSWTTLVLYARAYVEYIGRARVVGFL